MNGNVKSLKVPLSGPEKWKWNLGKTKYKKCELTSSLYTVCMGIQQSIQSEKNKIQEQKIIVLQHTV
jgi:hypothetical protein